MIMVTVPMGGVKEGEKFAVPFQLKPNAYMEASTPTSPIPVGHWKVSSIHTYCDL